MTDEEHRFEEGDRVQYRHSSADGEYGGVSFGGVDRCVMMLPSEPKWFGKETLC